MKDDASEATQPLVSSSSGALDGLSGSVWETVLLHILHIFLFLKYKEI